MLAGGALDGFRESAVVLVGTENRRVIVVEASPAAIVAGARVGLSLAEVRAVCGELRVLKSDAAGDRRALEALGRWMTRFTPVVATGWTEEQEYNGRITCGRMRGGNMPAGLLMNVTGCERLFGSTGEIVRRVREAMVRFGLPARVAAAPTALAAWGLAWAGEKAGAVVEDENLEAAVGVLPVEALRLPEEVASSLRRLGLVTIGRVMKLPRQAVPSRFGKVLLDRLDELVGNREEVLVPLRHTAPIEAKMEFDGPLASQEVMWLVMKELLVRVVVELNRRGAGARRLELVCREDYVTRRQAVVKVVDLTRPTRDIKRMHELLCRATDQIDCGQGFVTMQLKVPLHERMSDEQIELMEGQDHKQRQELEDLLERLTLRLGREAVVGPEVVESYLPERAWRAGEFSTRPRTARVSPIAVARPMRLLGVPAEVRVVAEPSDDREGRPAQFAWKGQVYRLVDVTGPERIGGEWWRGHVKVRDYYDALDETGRRFWLFRVMGEEGGKVRVRWFLHGVFQ